MKIETAAKNIGISLIEGEIYSPRQIRKLVRSLKPVYVRHVGVESVVKATGRMSQPITQRVPNRLPRRSYSLGLEFGEKSKCKGVAYFEPLPGEEFYIFTELNNW